MTRYCDEYARAKDLATALRSTPAGLRREHAWAARWLDDAALEDRVMSMTDRELLLYVRAWNRLREDCR